MKKILTILFCLLHFQPLLRSQTDSCDLRFSLLTCSPGEELYSSFGHTALRVINAENGSDIVFNYGTFDFYDPDFYSKFVKGKLRYFVSIDAIRDFMMEYQYYGRGVTEQVLNLSCGEKSELLAALYENAREENKYYRYDFNYDNCTTRIRDIIRKYSRDTLVTGNIIPVGKLSFRDLIHIYLEKNGQYWSEFGIDILLGSPLDKKLTNEEAMFLPDYLMKACDSTRKGDQPLVVTKNQLLPYSAAPTSSFSLKPVYLFSLVALVLVIASFIGRRKYTLLWRITDSLIFGLIGLIGCLLVFMWAGTDHAMCKNNLNLLWALPTHLAMAGILFTKSKWVSVYFMGTALLSLGLLLGWFLLPQALHPALIPVVFLTGVRSYFISKARRS